MSDTTERRPLTHAELKLLADAWLVEFPELRRLRHSDILESWRRLAERHHLVVEHRKPKRPPNGVIEQ